MKIDSMDKVVSLCKRRGFVFPGSDIYGGLKGTWDLGPLGVALNNNIKKEWWKFFVENREDMYGLDAAILMNAKVWEASGHTGAGFCDPLVEDTKTGERFRADHLLKEVGVEADGLTLNQIDEAIASNKIKSPAGNDLSPARQFNLMFETRIGATSGEEGKVYLRPETAQGIFVNFKNVVDSMSPKIPFGIAQIGKAFRNEIAPREWLFRVREFEQMEIESKSMKFRKMISLITVRGQLTLSTIFLGKVLMNYRALLTELITT
jgi:glycyl-tRNA synthetase